MAACYEPQSMTIIMPAVDPSEDDPIVNESAAFTFAHEYGHHVDARRWGPDPVSLGPMYWSSQQFACLKAQRGEAYTGGTDAEYYDDPTEAFADVYATLAFPGVPWEWTDTFRPDQAAFDAALRDVTDQWQPKPPALVKLAPGQRSRTVTVPMSLDGVVRVTATGSPRSRLRITEPRRPRPRNRRRTRPSQAGRGRHLPARARRGPEGHREPHRRRQPRRQDPSALPGLTSPPPSGDRDGGQIARRRRRQATADLEAHRSCLETAAASAV